MKFDKEDIASLLEIVGQAETFKPVAQQIVSAVGVFKPEIASLFSDLAKGIVDRRVDMIKRFEEHGFTRDEAMILTMDEWYGIRQALKNNKG